MNKKLLFFFYCVMLSLSSLAQGSLTDESISEDLLVGGQSFTVLRDASDPNQWYYVSKAPTISETVEGNTLIPEFSLIEYVTKDENNKEIAGGILNVALTSQLPAATIDALKRQIQNEHPGSLIRLTALVPKDAMVSLYTPSGNGNSKLITTSVQGNGIAPVFSTQKMVFQIELTNLGSNVMQEMVNGSKGLPVAVTYTYLGLTPKKEGFKVTVNWDQTYNFYSRDEKFRANASYFGFFGASYQYSSQKIASDLSQNNCIKVEATLGANFTNADLEKYLQPILTTINAEMLEFFAPPAAITPAAADNPNASGSFFSAGYSVAMKQSSQNKHGQQTFDFSFQQIIERKTIAGGLLGVGKYLPAVRNKLVSVVQGGAIKTAYFSLPKVFNEDDVAMMGLSEVDIKTTVSGNGQTVDSRASWKAGDKLWTIDGHFQGNELALPLGSVLLNNDMRNLNIATDVQIFTDNNNINYTENTVPTNEQYSVTALNSPKFSTITVDPSYLEYKKTSPDSKLISIEMNIKNGNKSIKRSFKPIFKNNQWQIPLPVKFLLNEGESFNNIAITMSAILSDGTTKEWKYNNARAFDHFRGNDVILLMPDFNL